MAGLFAGLIFLALPTAGIFGPTADVATTSFLPFTLAEHNVLWAGNRAYTFGGTIATISDLHTRMIVQYDPVTGATNVLPAQLPEGRSQMAAVWDGRVAYLFGGQDPTSQATDTVFIFNPSTGSVTLSPIRLPYRVEMASAVWTGSKAYIFGGTDATTGVNFDTVIEFDPNFGSATQILLRLPHPVHAASAVWDGNAAYLFGGTISDGSTAASTNTNLIVKFVPPTGTYPGSVGPMTARLDYLLAHSSAFYDGSKAYVLGGVTATGELDWIGEFDPVAGTLLTWSHKLPLAEQFGDATLDPVHGCGYLFGGAKGAAWGRRDIVVIGDPPCREDTDRDGIRDAYDNCSAEPNPGQEDLDEDGLGDACDPDIDGDLRLNGNDNCVFKWNFNQENLDGDAFGDACDDDIDGDTVFNSWDNCPRVPNPAQADLDGDTLGDACDGDWDGDGILNTPDNCPVQSNNDQVDLDGDGLGDVCDGDMDGDTILNAVDNCVRAPNQDQADIDGDKLGDACDNDWDNDGVANLTDNCLLVFNPGQADVDLDAIGDACDPDIDGDGVLNGPDNCVFTPNPSQADRDNDGVGDACESDLDHDGILNVVDNCVLVPNPAQADLDRDGLGDVCDPDIDGDGVLNGADNCVVVANPGQENLVHPALAGDACEDPDGDGRADGVDNCPDVANSNQRDSIHPGGGGDECQDFDLDGRADLVDNCPSDPNADQADQNHDGYGDVCQPPIICPPPFVVADTNGDGWLDGCMPPPQVATGIASGATPFWVDAPPIWAGSAHPAGEPFSLHAWDDPEGGLLIWNLGDGSAARGTEVRHAYAPGIYNVTLSSARGTTWLLIEVRSTWPVADFSWSGGMVGVGKPFAFQDRSQAPRGVNDLLWDFGDGITAKGARPEHAFSEPGAHNVTLTIYEKNGARASAHHTVVVQPAPVAVVSRFFVVVSGGRFTLDASRSQNPGDVPLEFDWEQVAGPMVRLEGGQKFEAIAPGVEVATNLTFTLQVSGSTGQSVPVELRVQVQPLVSEAKQRPVTEEAATLRAHAEPSGGMAPWALAGSLLAIGGLAVILFGRRRR